MSIGNNIYFNCPAKNIFFKETNNLALRQGKEYVSYIHGFIRFVLGLCNFIYRKEKCSKHLLGILFGILLWNVCIHRIFDCRQDTRSKRQGIHAKRLYE